MQLFYIRGADKISYIDGEVGPNGSDDRMNWIAEPYQSEDPATDILLDGMRIHDFTKHTAGAHIDCIGIDNVDGIIDPQHAHLDLRALLDHLRERPHERIRRSERSHREQLLRLLRPVGRRVLLDRLRRRRRTVMHPLQLD